ncbi:MAG: hypothetical protein PUF72_05570 [Clostridiales bacterium]|nr:hypothetical protein [Clostridiales bacterium]
MAKDFLCDEYDFYTKSYEEFQNTLENFTKDSEWIPAIVAKQMKASSIDGPIMAQNIAADTGCDFNAVYDTASEGTQIMLSAGGKKYMLGRSAISGLCDTAKISGSALRKLSAYQLSEVINICLTVARGNSLLLHRNGKIRAILSDAIYEVMPMTEVMQSAKKTLSGKMGKAEFVGGYIDHNIAMAEMVFNDRASEVCQAYRSAAYGGSHLYTQNFVPGCTIVTSDTGSSAARCIPVFKTMNGSNVRFCKPIEVVHKHLSQDTCLEKFIRGMNGAYALFQDVETSIGRLAKIWVDNPLNVIVGISKKLLLPKKYAAQAYDELTRILPPSNRCSMDDVYLCMAQIPYFAKCAGAGASKCFELEEQVSKILTLPDLKEFDLPGTVSW